VLEILVLRVVGDDVSVVIFLMIFTTWREILEIRVFRIGGDDVSVVIFYFFVLPGRRSCRFLFSEFPVMT
jgi:hypothetical protein